MTASKSRWGLVQRMGRSAEKRQRGCEAKKQQTGHEDQSVQRHGPRCANRMFLQYVKFEGLPGPIRAGCAKVLRWPAS